METTDTILGSRGAGNDPAEPSYIRGVIGIGCGSSHTIALLGECVLGHLDRHAEFMNLSGKLSLNQPIAPAVLGHNEGCDHMRAYFPRTRTLQPQAS
jgi:hypothetical protein